jgi:hypothetical protein
MTEKEKRDFPISDSLRLALEISAFNLLDVSLDNETKLASFILCLFNTGFSFEEILKLSPLLLDKQYQLVKYKTLKRKVF